MKRKLFFRHVSVIAILLLLTAGMFPANVFSAETNREIRPPAGFAAFEAGQSELLDLRINTRPRAGDTPLHEWFLLAASTLDDIYILTPGGIDPLSSVSDFSAYTYPFAHSSETDFIGTLRMSDLGLHPGDILYYAYAYTPSDLSHAVLDNIVAIEVKAEENGLRRFSSRAELENYLKKGLKNIGEREMILYGSPFAGGEVTAAPNADASGSGAKSLFSATNIQEAGVDEADVIKTDGKYLYIAPEYAGYDYWLMGGIAADTSLPPGETAERESAVRIMEIAENPPSAKEVGKISLGDKNVDGLYLLTDRGENKADLLVTVSGNKNDIWGCWFAPWSWTEGKTEVMLYNVSNPASPQKITGLELDGHLISSRRIGDTLYLVTRYTPMPEGYMQYAWDEKDIRNNEAILENTDLGDMLPGLRINGGAERNLVSPANCFIPPLDEERAAQPSLITITALPLDSPDNPVSQTVSGPTETIYVSPDSLYLATVRYDYAPCCESGGPGEFPENTDLHKFSLTETGPVYKASGSVPGNLGWEEDKKPFRMSEYDNVLRIATSLGYTWDGSASTRLSLLKENGESGLEEISHIDGIGEEGERLYAVRFAGQNAYIVTFRVTDPLYVFDLSDPENPKELGELHIEGYSDYLHPIGDNLLLGVGKDAVPDTSSPDFGGRGAWYQGLKLSLFDISVPSNPKEVNSLVIGKRGTHSEVLGDHHAFTYLPPADGKAARLAIPVELHDKSAYYSQYDNPSAPWSYYGWTHTGLYLFNIYTGEQNGGKTGIEQQGKMIAAENISDPSTPYYNGYQGSYGDRSVILGDSVHYVHDTSVWSASWGSGADMTNPQ